MKCLRCGACCYFVIDGKPTNIPCEHLKFKNDKTYCDIYKHRLGTKIKDNVECGLRKDTVFDYEDCPYNTDKPLLRNNKLII